MVIRQKQLTTQPALQCEPIWLSGEGQAEAFKKCITVRAKERVFLLEWMGMDGSPVLA